MTTATELTKTAQRVPLCAYIDADLFEKLGELARENDRSRSAEVRRALAVYAEQHQAAARAAIANSRAATTPRPSAADSGRGRTTHVDIDRLRPRDASATDRSGRSSAKALGLNGDNGRKG